MSDNKISVSLDEVNSATVDAELNRQEVSNRMAEHQEKIRINFGGSGEMLGSKGGFFRKAITYMAVFGIIFSILGWWIGEVPMKASKNNPVIQVQQLVSYILNEQPDISLYQLKDVLREIKEKMPELSKNEYLPNKFLDMDKTERERVINDAYNKTKALEVIWFIVLGMTISIGLSIAEPCVAKNIPSAVKNGLLGGLLGGIGGFLVSLFINVLYNSLQSADGNFFQQMVARGIGWSVLGAFLAIAPGIIMRSWKKMFLGLAGGAIGGLLGGVLFDPICQVFKSSPEAGVAIARFVNIIGLGVGAAVATVLLENIAKQGWLKVAAGLIAGKQFILYRNPTVIGSSPKCEIYLFKDPQIAAQHAAINNRNGDFIITAINGAQVFVNNAPTPQQRLKTGDQIRIGNTIFIFETKVLKTQKS